MRTFTELLPASELKHLTNDEKKQYVLFQKLLRKPKQNYFEKQAKQEIKAKANELNDIKVRLMSGRKATLSSFAQFENIYFKFESNKANEFIQSLLNQWYEGKLLTEKQSYHLAIFLKENN
jgi:hypothetical protein